MFGFRWSPRQVHDNDAPDSGLVCRNDRPVKRLLRRRPVETFQRRFKFGVGEWVRLLKRQSIFDKAYQGKYAQEVFCVEECKWAPWCNWVALYRIKDLTGEDVRGWFYEHELARVPRSDKCVKTTVSRKKKSCVVTFEDYAATYTEEVSLVDGGLSRDTFKYAQDLARVDRNEDDFHVHLFLHDRRAGVEFCMGDTLAVCPQVTWTVIRGLEAHLLSDTTN